MRSWLSGLLQSGLLSVQSKMFSIVGSDARTLNVPSAPGRSGLPHARLASAPVGLAAKHVDSELGSGVTCAVSLVRTRPVTGSGSPEFVSSVSDVVGAVAA